MITLKQAKEHKLCRVCGLPIYYLSLPGAWWENENPHQRRGDGLASKNETELAHSACLVEQDLHPFVQA
jgi:hypothetical protein